MVSKQGSIQKFFEGGGEFLLYGRENLEGFWIFFLKKSQRGGAGPSS